MTLVRALESRATEGGWRSRNATAMPDDDVSAPPFGAFAPSWAQAAVIALAHGSGLKRGAFRPTLSRLLNLLRAGPIDANYQGASFRFHHQFSATERGALFNPDYDRAELDFLRAHVPSGGVFVDVGANIGTYALTLARHVGSRGRVVAIEAHPVAHARLAFNVAASGLTQVRLVAAAASDSDGELMIATDTENLGASRIVPAAAADQAYKVRALRLARIVNDAGLTKIHALKIDVEGFEDRVLTGFFRDVAPASWPRAIAIEHLSRSEWRQDCLVDMIGRGYREAGRTRSNTLLLRD